MRKILRRIKYTLETIKIVVIQILGKLKHEIDLEAHSLDRLYWAERRIASLKRDLEEMKGKVEILEENARQSEINS